MSSELLIIGTSGLAKEVALVARQIDPHSRRWSSISYVAENSSAIGRTMPFGVIKYTDSDLAEARLSGEVVLGIGSPLVRQGLVKKLSSHGSRFTYPNLISPNANVDLKHIRLGVGNIIAGGVQFTVDIEVGNFNLFNLNVTVGHDTQIKSYCVVNPSVNISGGCEINSCCLLGTGSQVLENLSMVENVIVGAGAVVSKSINMPGTYVGIPARPLSKG